MGKPTTGKATAGKPTTGKATRGANPRPEHVRLFVSVNPAPAAVRHLSAVISELEVARANAPGHSTRIADPASWHLTLAFIGAVPADRAQAGPDALARAVAATTEPITISLGGGGRFGRGKFTVLWVGVDGDLGGLRALAGRVRRELRRSRLPFDHRPLRPHLTIARPGDRIPAAAVRADLQALADYQGPAWRVEEVHLMRSELGPRPVYTTVAASRLVTG